MLHAATLCRRPGSASWTPAPTRPGDCAFRAAAPCPWPSFGPGVLSGANGDDQYLERVRRYGDNNDPGAHIKALASYGIEAEFTQKASFRTIEAQIPTGIPVPCGYRHRGPVEKPGVDSLCHHHDP